MALGDALGDEPDRSADFPTVRSQVSSNPTDPVAAGCPPEEAAFLGSQPGFHVLQAEAET